VSLEKHYTMICDGCGRRASAPRPRPGQARRYVRKQGWTQRARRENEAGAGELRDLCTRCSEREAAAS
jgi:hypothetical protein